MSPTRDFVQDLGANQRLKGTAVENPDFIRGLPKQTLPQMGLRRDRREDPLRANQLLREGAVPGEDLVPLQITHSSLQRDPINSQLRLETKRAINKGNTKHN